MSVHLFKTSARRILGKLTMILSKKKNRIHRHPRAPLPLECHSSRKMFEDNYFDFEMTINIATRDLSCIIKYQKTQSTLSNPLRQRYIF